jgi:hypothetical protein
MLSVTSKDRAVASQPPRCRFRYLCMPAAHSLRRAAHAFLFVVPYVEPDVAGECLEHAARLLWILGPDPFGFRS